MESHPFSRNNRQENIRTEQLESLTIGETGYSRISLVVEIASSYVLNAFVYMLVIMSEYFTHAWM